MSRNNDYKTANLLDYLQFQKKYKLIGINLSRQANTTIPLQINFTGIFEADDVVAMQWNIRNLLNEASDSKFVTRNWSIGNDQSNGNYDAGN